MKLLFTLFLSLLNLRFSENVTPKLLINDVFLSRKDGAVHIKWEIINGSNTNIFYKPNDNHDFCLRINYVLFKNLSNKRESYYLPCTALADMNRINITSENSIVLSPNEHYKCEFILKQKGFNSTIFANKEYNILLNINYKNICGGDTCNVFTGGLSSNKNILIKN